MLGWGYRFCEKRMLIKNEITEGEAEKFIKKFEEIYKSGLNEEVEHFRDAFIKICKLEDNDDADEFMKRFRKVFNCKMKVYNLIKA